MGLSHAATPTLDRVVYASLLQQQWTDNRGITRPIRSEDILVVSPYNVQVNHLKSALPTGAQVGTVDKFQGQEAPVVLISMATSSGDDIPRNLEFLFSRNRLNVAISRAQGLAVIFASPKLLDIPCTALKNSAGYPFAISAKTPSPSVWIDGLRAQRARGVEIEGSRVGVATERPREGRHNGPTCRVGVTGRIERDGHFEDARFADTRDQLLQHGVLEPEIDGLAAPTT